MSTGFFGCTEKISLEGTVKKEFGGAAALVASPGNLIANESVKIGNETYGLVIESGGKEYTITVKEYRTKPISALAKAIEPGDKVKIVDGWKRPTDIDEDGIGRTYSNNVRIVEKAKK